MTLKKLHYICRHPRVGGDLGVCRGCWIPAFAGMTMNQSLRFMSFYDKVSDTDLDHFVFLVKSAHAGFDYPLIRLRF